MSFIRFVPLAASLVVLMVTLLALPAIWAWAPMCLAAILSMMGLYDLGQSVHSVRRNYPLVAAFVGFSKIFVRVSGNIFSKTNMKRHHFHEANDR